MPTTIRQPWQSAAEAQSENEEVRRYRALGVNEQVYSQSQWIRWFDSAGFELRLIQLRWDRIVPGEVVYGGGVNEANYLLQILTRRQGEKSLGGLLASTLLGKGLWRSGLPILRSDSLRRLLLHQTRKPRLLTAIKPT
jgi:hypothetical protein